MAHVFSITDGTTTITLTNTAPYLVTAYDMATIDDGSDSTPDDPQITESLDVLVISTTSPNVQLLARAVELLLETAKRRQTTRSGPRVFFQLQVDGDATVWRSEIIDGRFKPDKDTLENWYSKKVPYHLMLTHRVWEGPRKELEIASASSTTPNTGGKPITNGQASYIQILGSQVGGVLPAPVELQLTNTSGVSIQYGNFYLANNAFSDPTNFAFNIEGETSSDGADVSDGTCSNALYNLYGTTSSGYIRWNLSSATMQDTQGRSFRLIARFFGWSGTNLYVKPSLRSTTDGSILFEGDEQKLASSWDLRFIDLGSIPLPPGGYFTSYTGTTLWLEVRATGALTLGIDFIHLLALDSYQNIYQMGGVVPNNTTITFDNIERNFHLVGNTLFSPRSGTLKVFPGVTQRIHIIYDEETSSNVSRTMTVKAYIRERRLTV